MHLQSREKYYFKTKMWVLLNSFNLFLITSNVLQINKNIFGTNFVIWHFLKAENSEDSLASLCVESSISWSVM